MVVARLMVVRAHGRHDDVLAAYDEVAARITSRPGFVSSTFAQDAARGEFVSLTIWASEEHAGAGAAANFASIRETFAVLGAEVLRHDLFAVTHQLQATQS